MGIQRVRQWQRLESTDDVKSWSEKHLKDHGAESSLRIQDFDHNRLTNLHPSMLVTDSPTFVGLTLSGLTASKPVFTSAAKALVSTGTLAVDQGGTGLTSLGAANAVLGVNAAASAHEYKAITAGTGITVTPTAGVLTIDCTVSTAGFVPTSRTISTTSPLSGGGNLSANRTFSLAGLSAIGTANYVIGVNAAANAWETKNVAAGTNISVTHAAGSITIANTAPVVIDASAHDITADLTWDDAWYDFDFTSHTSATARWVILSIWFNRDGDFCNPIMFGSTGNAADATCWAKFWATWTGSTNYGSIAWIPLDANQVVAYHCPTNTTTKFVKILGYM